MQTQTIVKLISAALISLLISACGGGSSSALDNYNKSSPGNTINNSSSSTNNSANSNSANSSVASSVDTTSPRKIGVGSGVSFNEGAIGVGIGNTPLAAGGTTSLTVNIVSDTNTLVTNAIDITFNSECFAAGEARFSDNQNNATSTVSTTNGQVSIIYTANGCIGDDLITATASLDGVVKNAQVTLTVEADTVQTLSFIDANPTRISLKGTGGIETSRVRFRVSGSTGAPVKDIQVSMTLNTTVGGLCLADPANNATCVSTVVGSTDNNGDVSVTVQAGSIPAPIRITATAVDTSISTQSNELLVSTGIPDQDSMSISATLLNPECYEVDGVPSTITMRMADSFNNPPPTGTAVSFWTEGGRISSGCSTDVAGECSVTWTCQSPRPADGRVTIMGFAQGNESFDDQDGDGYYDGADNFTTNHDFAEAFLDANEDGIHDATERFVDFNQNLSYTNENGIYNGVLCKTEGSICTKTGITVRGSLVIAMSSRALIIDITEVASIGTTRQFQVTLSDKNGNSAPGGTTLDISNDLEDGSARIVGSSTVGNTTEPSNFIFTVSRSDSTIPVTGTVTISAETPDGYTEAVTVGM